MKIALFALGLMTSLSSFAQVSGNGMAVCESIRRNTAYQERVTLCVQKVNRISLDAQAVNLLVKLATSSTTETLNGIDAAANAVYDPSAIATCESIRTNTAYAERVVECLRNSANNTYSPDVAALATRLATSSTMEANKIIKQSANSFFMPEAVSACEAIRVNTAYAERVTACVGIIQNKVFMNGSEAFCKEMASSSTLEANKCLASSALDYVPAPSRDIIMSAQELRGLKLDLSKARKQLERGNTAQALLSIGDALRAIEVIEANNR